MATPLHSVSSTFTSGSVVLTVTPSLQKVEGAKEAIVKAVSAIAKDELGKMPSTSSTSSPRPLSSSTSPVTLEQFKRDFKNKYNELDRQKCMRDIHNDLLANNVIMEIPTALCYLNSADRQQAFFYMLSILFSTQAKVIAYEHRGEKRKVILMNMIRKVYEEHPMVFSGKSSEILKGHRIHIFSLLSFICSGKASSENVEALIALEIFVNHEKASRKHLSELVTSLGKIKDVELKERAFDGLYRCLFSSGIEYPINTEWFFDEVSKILEYLERVILLKEEKLCKWYCGFSRMLVKESYRDAEGILASFDTEQASTRGEADIKEHVATPIGETSKRMLAETRVGNELIFWTDVCASAVREAKSGEFSVISNLTIPAGEFVGEPARKLVEDTLSQIAKMRLATESDGKSEAGSVEAFFLGTIEPHLRRIVAEGSAEAVGKIDSVISQIVKEKELFRTNAELQQLQKELVAFRGRLTWNLEQWEEFGKIINERNDLNNLIKKLERLNPMLIETPVTPGAMPVAPIVPASIAPVSPVSSTPPPSLAGFVASALTISSCTEEQSEEMDWESTCVVALNHAKSGHFGAAEERLSRRANDLKLTHSANSIALLGRTREQINTLATFFVRETLRLNLQMIAAARRTQVYEMMIAVANQIYLGRSSLCPETISDELHRLRIALGALSKDVNDWSMSRWEEFGKIVNEEGASLQSLTEQLELFLSVKESAVPVPPFSSSSKLSGSSINSMSSGQINKAIMSCMNDADNVFDVYECVVNIEQILDEETRNSALDTLHGCLFSDEMSLKRMARFSEQADLILECMDNPRHGFSEKMRCKWFCGFAVMFANLKEHRKAEGYIEGYESWVEAEGLLKIELGELLKAARQQVNEICCRAYCSGGLMRAKLGNFKSAYEHLRSATDVPFAGTILGAESTKLIADTEAQIKELDKIASAKIAIVLEPANIPKQ